MKVASPARGCIEVDGVSGRRYRAKDGMYEMSKRDAKALVAYGGFIPSAMGAFNSGLGYYCQNCGFGSFFRKCGRCGGECERG